MAWKERETRLGGEDDRTAKKNVGGVCEMPRSNSLWKAITYSKHISSGEPDDAKVSSPVRRGVCGKVSARITRHIPTLLYVMAGCAQGVAAWTNQTGEGNLLGLRRSDGGKSTGIDGPENGATRSRLSN